MLVLSRKVGERIHIGNDVFVEVRRIAGSRTTLAVSAPKNVRILRGELVESSAGCEVLDEPALSESEKDTVIMKTAQFPRVEQPNEPEPQQSPTEVKH